MGNFVKFYDAVGLRPLEIKKEVKDFYANLNSSPNMKVQPLRVRIAATHAGKVTRNNGFYLPHKMVKGVASFTAQYPKPIQIHHQDKVDPIGRAVQAAYIDLSRGFRDSVSDSFTVSMADELDDFVAGRLDHKGACEFATKFFINDAAVNADPDYEGLGYIELIAEITDGLAIQKILDGRYLTGSTGATTNKAVCSICKQDWAEDGKCEHKPGRVYDSAKCVLIAGDLSYDEYSFVNKPADRHSRVIEVNINGIQDFVTIDEEEVYTPEITLVVDQNKQSEEDLNMTFKEALELAQKQDRFKDIDTLVDDVKRLVDAGEDLDEEKLCQLLDEVYKPAEEGSESGEEQVADEADSDAAATTTAEVAPLDAEQVTKLVQDAVQDALAQQQQVADEKKAEEKAASKVEDKVQEATQALQKERDELQAKLNVARKEIRYLHADIENLTDSMANSIEEAREARVRHILDLRTLSDEEVDIQVLSDELKTKTSEDLQRMLVDLGSKVDTQEIADTLNSGLSNSPAGTVDDPTQTQDNTKKSQEAAEGTDGEAQVNDDVIHAVKLKWLQIRTHEGPEAADKFIEDCKAQKVIPAEWPVKENFQGGKV